MPKKPLKVRYLEKIIGEKFEYIKDNNSSYWRLFLDNIRLKVIKNKITLVQTNPNYVVNDFITAAPVIRILDSLYKEIKSFKPLEFKKVS